MEKKTRQILKLEHGYHSYHVVLHLRGECNPYWIYKDEWNYTKHRPSHKLIAKYADLASVMYYLYDCVSR